MSLHQPVLIHGQNSSAAQVPLQSDSEGSLKVALSGSSETREFAGFSGVFDDEQTLGAGCCSLAIAVSSDFEGTIGGTAIDAAYLAISGTKFSFSATPGSTLLGIVVNPTAGSYVAIQTAVD